MIGNNVQHVEADVAPIWLAVDTSHCTVVGGSNKTNVLDEGSDNVIAGVNNMGGHPLGPAIQEAMERKLETLSDFPWAAAAGRGSYYRKPCQLSPVMGPPVETA